MRLFNSRFDNITAGLESDVEELGGAVPEQNPAPIADNAESLETEIIEVQDGAAELEEREAVLEQTEDVREALESLADTYRGALANGGLSQREAGYVRMHHDHLRAQVGLNQRHSVGTEDFGSLATRDAATRAGLESAMEDVKKVWEKIVQWIKNGIARVVEFFQNLFGAAEKMGKRADGLAEAAKKIEGQGSVIKKPKLAAALMDSETGDVVKASDAVAIMKDVVNKGLEEWANKTGKDIEASVKLFETAPSADATISFAAPSWMAEGSFSEKITKKAPEGCKVVGAKVLGGIGIFAVVPKADGKLGDAAARKAYSGVSFFSGEWKAGVKPKVEELQPLSSADAVAVTAAVKATSLAVVGFKRSSELSKAYKERLAKAAETMGNREKGNEAPEVGEMYKWLRGQCTRTAALVDHPAVELNALGVRLGKTLLDYVELSVKAHAGDGTEAKQPAAEAPAA